jgi:uncharacterized Fe-S cluster-containing radical SAM superfamily protein
LNNNKTKINSTIQDNLNKFIERTPDKSIQHRIKGYSGTNPFELADYLKTLVCRGDSRKYYRFRGGRFYGGIAGADCVGCMLDCVFCWSYKPRCNPHQTGQFYSPKQVVEKLMDIARSNGYNKIRITGNEPTLCHKHLISVLDLVPNDKLFILETNGLLLDEEYVSTLASFKDHLHVRVSLKGADPEQFSQITAMESRFHNYQFKALHYLTEAGISCNPAIMSELLDDENIHKLVEKLKIIDPNLALNLELEGLIMYPFIEKELQRRGLNKRFKLV